MNHAVQPDVTRGLASLTSEVGTITRSVGTSMTTVPSTERALLAAKRLRRLAAAMETALRRQIADNRQAEREATREAERAERRNDAIRRERGLPSGSADLGIPAVSA